MSRVQLVIVCDPATGAVSINGPLDNTFLCGAMLAEARRILEQRAAARDAAQGNGGLIVGAHRVPTPET